MGYGIQMAARSPSGGLFGRSPGASRLLRSLETAFAEAISDPLQEKFLRFERLPNALHVTLHPASEDMEITVDGETLHISVKTSTAGPGYHAFIVQLLEEIAQSTGLALGWSSDDGAGDDTGYATHLDLGKLRGESMRMLKSIARHVLDAGEEAASFRINMPLDGDTATGDLFATGPMGKYSRNWFEDFLKAEGRAAEKLAEDFFPAWHGPHRAEYWAGIARYLMLWEIDWTAPSADAERQRYETVRDCCLRARRMDPDLALPETALAELERLLECMGDPAPPAAEGFGFRRGNMVRPLGGSWTAKIPGYFRRGETTHESGAHQYYWFGDREIHFSRLIFKSDGAGLTAENMIHANSGDEEGSATFVFRPARTWMKAAATVRRTEDYWTVQAGFGVSRGEEQDLLILTVIHEDHEEGALWARKLLESVSCPEHVEA